MFEQSILIDNRRNQPWSLLASVSAELVVVSILIIVPLIYGDHLPDFHWRTVTVGPAVHRAPQQPQPTHPTGGPRHLVFQYPRENINPGPSRQASASASGPVSLDPPVGIDLGGQRVPGPGLQFEKPINIAAPPPKPVPPRAPSGPIHVSGGVQMAKLVKQVIPIYPQFAKSAGVSGVVRLVGIIGKDGSIRDLQLVSGHPLLAKAALDAVAQWVYRPTLLSGVPVEVICPIEVDFKLSK